MNPFKYLLLSYRYWRARRANRQMLDFASACWMKIACSEPHLVETLEGLRGLARQGLMDSKLIRVVGTFEVHSPIEIDTVGTVYDFEDCVLIAKCYPAMITRGRMNCLNAVFISMENDTDEEIAPFESLRCGEEPSGKSVVCGYADTGTAFIDLNILNVSDIVELVAGLESCPVTEPSKPEGLLD